MLGVHALMVSLWLTLPTLVLADTPRKTLVLTVEEDGMWHRTLHQELEAGLRRRSTQLVESVLTDAERACRELSCLNRLGLAHGVQNILLASYYSKRNRLDVFLFDLRSQGRDRRSEDVAVSERPERLIELSAELLHLGPAVGSLPSADATQVGHAQIQRPWAPTKLPRWRVGLGVSLGSLGAGALTAAMAATWLHGQSGPTSKCQSVPLMAATTT
jgi:hypothetical protein